MLLFPREKTCWNVGEIAVLCVIEKFGGMASYSELKKYLVAKKKIGEQSLLQKEIKEQIENIPASRRPELNHGFKSLRMTEPTLIKTYESLKKEHVISYKLGKKIGKNKIIRLYAINSKYKGYVTNLDGTGKRPLYDNLLWNFIAREPHENLKIA